MKVNFSHSCIYAIIITLIIPVIMPFIVAAAETPSEDDGNPTILLPDLIIESLSWWPVNPEIGEQVTFTATVKNQGDAASGSTNLAFYSNGNKIGEGSVPEMEAGSSGIISFSWISETESTVEISAKVDESESVEEKEEDNNVITADSISFKKTKLPDLTIDAIEYPENIIPGDPLNIQISVSNTGTEASEATKLVLYINGNSEGEWDVPGLSGGESIYATYSAQTSSSEGSLEIKAVVDEDNIISESNEENNEKTVTITLDILPDLIIEDLIPESTEAEKGKLLNFILKVKNQGTTPSGEVLAEYYINGKAPPSQGIHVPALSAGTGTDVTFSLTPDREGKMEVRVLVDSGKSVYESNENNNQFTKIIDVKTILPDLIIESLSLNPETPKIGDNVAFTASVKNKGFGDSGSSELNYYIDGTSTTYSGKISVPVMVAGETTTGTFYWVPQEEGTLNVRLVADGGSAIREGDETNNELTESISVSTQTTTVSGGSSGSSSSSSSSSMGGGGSKEPARNIKVKELDTRNIMSGYHVKYDFAKNATCITFVEFDPTKNFKKTTATVEVLKGKSIFVQKNPPGRVYEQINIWIGNKGAGLPDYHKNAYTGFKVDKEWIKSNSVNIANIAFLWYDSKWKPLKTEKIDEDDNYVYFRAETIGYSCFAISEYTGEEGTVEESTDEDGIQETLRSWDGGGNAILNSSAEKEGNMEQKPMGMAKILLAISLPLFMLLVEYFILKKKI